MFKMDHKNLTIGTYSKYHHLNRVPNDLNAKEHIVLKLLKKILTSVTYKSNSTLS